MDELTRRRLTHNEELFRAINEEITDAHAGPDGRRIKFFCECAEPRCAQHIELTEAEYEEVRRNPKRFIIVPGHAVPELEEVVEDAGRYAVVEKRDAVRTPRRSA